MTLDDRRETAVKLLDAYTRYGFDAARPYLAEGFTWSSPWTGEVQDRLDSISAAVKKHLKAPITLNVTGTTAEGERVAVEGDAYGELSNGKIYNDHFHILVLFKDGKVIAVKEYNDSKHAAETWEGVF